MVVGSLVVGMCLGVLGWTGALVEFVGGPAAAGTEERKSTVLLVAVLAIYAVDFAINAVQACCRSLIVDMLALEHQQLGSAWAARMSAFGHVVGYGVGSIDLVTLMERYGLAAVGGRTQFQKMICVSILGLWGCVGVTCWGVSERRLVSTGSEAKESAWVVLKGLWRRSWGLPRRMRLITYTQFWVWIGWFPFLFFGSLWVGETYVRYEADGITNEKDKLALIGRLGSTALVWFSFVTFASSLVLPRLVRSPEGEVGEKFTPRPPDWITHSFVGKMKIGKPDLVMAWMLSNLAFAFIMFWAPAVRSLRGATILVAACGVPWSVSGWAPFAEMGAEINKMGRICESKGEEDDFEMQRARTSSDGLLLSHRTEQPNESPNGELAGVYLGILNVWTTLPQFVGTFISWIVFSILEPNKDDKNKEGQLLKSEEGPNSIAVCFFIGALCALVAGESARRLRKIS
jgi:solute carrier family 45, member 1/2/4